MEHAACRLCGTPLAEDDGVRCPTCGLHRAADLGRAGFRRLAFGLAGVYAVAALLVLLTRG